MTTPKSALIDLEALSDSKLAIEMLGQHKINRPYLGIPNPQIDMLYKTWRANTDTSQRVEIASYLWDSNIHEARIAAAKLLTQARINPDRAVWHEIQRWVPDFDVASITDHACAAGARRLPADLTRLDALETWTTHDNIWPRRAALLMTIHWAKQNHPSHADIAVRDRVLGWAGLYVPDHNPVIQKTIALWLRTLSKHDALCVQQFIERYGPEMKPFALKEASALL